MVPTADSDLNAVAPVMIKPFIIVVALLAVVVAGGVAFLATWDIPPPAARVEKVIANDRFAK